MCRSAPRPTFTVTVPCWSPVGKLPVNKPITTSGVARVATSQSPGDRPSSASRTQPPTVTAWWPAWLSRWHTSRTAGGTMASSRATSASTPITRSFDRSRAAQPAEDLLGPLAQLDRVLRLARLLAQPRVGAVAAGQLELVLQPGQDLDRAPEVLV